MKNLSWLLIAVLVACASDGSEEPADLPEPVCISQVGTPASDFVGLTGEAADELAGERNLQVREVGRDGECFPVTDDLREDRVNLEFFDDVVVGAAIY